MAYIGKQPVVGNFVKLDAITTSATDTYNLLNGGIAYSPQSANNCIVSLNGIIQEPTSSGNVGGYTISGSTIVFTSALTSLDVIDFILVLGDVLSVGVPSDNTVSLAKLTATGTKDATTFLRGDNSFAVPAGSKFGTALLHVRDEKSSGTDGGTNTTGSFVTRTLNTVMTNEISGASLASNKITLPAGTYFIYARVPAFNVDRHKTKLRNTTDSSDTLIGSNSYVSGSSIQVDSWIIGRFTIAGTKEFEIHYRNQTAITSTGLGLGVGYGVLEVYTDVQIWKVA